MNFTFNDHTLRHIILDGEPWFVAADVCRILGMDLSKGTTNHLRALDQTQKQVVTRKHLPDLMSGTSAPTLALISESGLYKLIMRSDKDTARPFQDWVTKEVLPAIRKTGGYCLNEEARATAHADTRSSMPLPEAFAQAFASMVEAIQRPLIDQLEQQSAQIISLKEHIERLASGEEPEDVWLTGELVKDMPDLHLYNAINWARRNGVPHEGLVRERSRRNRRARTAKAA